jgi:hypothetical protein
MSLMRRFGLRRRRAAHRITLDALDRSFERCIFRPQVSVRQCRVAKFFDQSLASTIVESPALFAGVRIER